MKLTAKQICDQIEGMLAGDIDQKPKMAQLVEYLGTKPRPFTQPPVWQPPYYNPNAPENVNNPANINNPQNPNNPANKRPPRVENLREKYPFA